MKIHALKSYAGIYKSEPSFKAYYTPKTRLILNTGSTSYLTDGTIRLKNGAPFFSGVKKLLNSLMILLNLKPEEKKYILYGILEKMRMEEILKGFPRSIFEKRKVYGILGSGVNKTALLMDKKEAVCFCEDMRVFNLREFEDFDLPMLAKGFLDGSSKKGWFIRKYGQPVKAEDLKALYEKIEKTRELKNRSRHIYDWYERQACKADGKVYLLDFECVK